MKKLLSGNESIAQGAFEAGCVVATGYPGTPGTEILENLSKYSGIDCEWSVNEKVAFEVACGASIAGGRAITVMKHVGLNVAADPLFTFAYTGVNGGFVCVTADDPGFHSSQNEQDNRLYALHAKVAMLEPSDSQECLDFTKAAFDLSERFNIPVLLRLTTRICHGTSMAKPGERINPDIKDYVKNTAKYVPIPSNASKLHILLEENLIRLAGYAEECPFNKKEAGSRKIGIITSGISYQYAKEAMGESASYLKLGLTHPLPQRMIKSFASQVEELFVIEENEPYLEMQIKAMGIYCKGKDVFPRCGELSPARIQKALIPGHKRFNKIAGAQLPARPSVLCPGCPHRGLFYVLGQYKDIIVTGDIGCYTLGISMPVPVTDTCLCMGGGFTVGAGFGKIGRMTDRKAKVMGIVGDSTFFHSGMTGLANAVYNGSSISFIILDNGSTAMTGHQENPGTGITLSGKLSKRIRIEAVVRALGVDDAHLRTVDPLDLKAMQSVVKEACENNALFVIIARRPCALQDHAENVKYKINRQKCKCLSYCMKIGCPSIIKGTDGAEIDEMSCSGCGLCKQVCKFDAIEQSSE